MVDFSDPAFPVLISSESCDSIAILDDTSVVAACGAVVVKISTEDGSSAALTMSDRFTVVEVVPAPEPRGALLQTTALLALFAIRYAIARPSVR